MSFSRLRSWVVEQHHLGVLGRGDGADFIRLAAAHEEARIGTVAPSADIRHGNGAGRARELLELLDIFGVRGCADPEAYKYSPFTCAGSLEHVS